MNKLIRSVLLGLGTLRVQPGSIGRRTGLWRKSALWVSAWNRRKRLLEGR